MSDLTPLLAPSARLADAAGAPALVSASGPEATRRFWEFFAVTIRNHNTRAA